MITQTFHSMKRNFFIRNVCLYILPLLIPLFLISVLAIVIINTYVKNEIDTRNINNLETNASTINALIDELERINITLSVNPSIKVRLKNVILKMEENNGIAAEDYQLVTAILDMLYSSVDYNPYIASVYIYFDNETEWFISNTNEFSNSDFFYDTDWLEKYKSKKGDTDRFWFEFRTIDNYLFQYGVSVKVLTIYNQIYSSGKSKPDGVLVLNVFEDELDTALGNLLEAPDESLYVVDNNGSIIFSNGKEGNLSSDELSLLDFGTSSSITYNGHCIYRVHSDSYNWMYYYTIPISSAYYMPRILTRAILIICMLSGLAGLILAYSFAYKSYKEIMELVEVIQQARNGKVSYSYEDDYGSDLFRYVMQNVIKSFLKIDFLELQISERKYHNKILEMAVLQYQLNPHFLYNTLQTILWKSIALSNGPNDVSEMIENLSDILHYALDSNETVVPIYEEISIAKAYINIQKTRYHNHFDSMWDLTDIDPDMKLPKLILQPLIENAIYHGIQQKKDPSTIRISIKGRENMLKIRVIDNGTGMSKENLQKLRKNLSLKNEGNSSHIGLANTNKRLQIIYEEKARLYINSRIGTGTIVTMIIPAYLQEKPKTEE